MNAGIYARLSMLKPTEQLTEAALERQEHDCRRLCEARGYTAIKVYPDEGVSAFQGRRRAGFELALDDLEAGVIDVLVCWKLDRLVRRLRDWIRVEEIVGRSGGKLVSVQEGDASRFTLRILASMAEEESSNTSKRVEAQQRQAAFKGSAPHGGHRLFGYSKGRTAIVEDEAAVIRESAERVLRGETLRSVVTWANEQGPSPTGGAWQQASFRRMLLNPGMVKLREYHGEIVAEGKWEAPPILTRDTWERLCVLLKDPARVSKAGRPWPGFLLSGLATCWHCRRPLVAHYRPKDRGGAREYLCLRGPGRHRCGKTSVIAEPLERLVEEVVLQELAEGRLAVALAAQGGIVTELSQQREVLKAKLREVGSMYDQDLIDKGEYLERRAALTERLIGVQGRLDREYSKTTLVELPTAEDELRDWWHRKATLDQQRTILKACLSAVVVGPGSKTGGPRFNAGRLKPPWGPQWKI